MFPRFTHFVIIFPRFTQFVYYSPDLPNLCTIPQIYPLNGPLQGGTLLTLEGVDLSIKYSDISNITVGGIICELQETGYKVSTQ